MIIYFKTDPKVARLEILPFSQPLFVVHTLYKEAAINPSLPM